MSDIDLTSVGIATVIERSVALAELERLSELQVTLAESAKRNQVEAEQAHDRAEESYGAVQRCGVAIHALSEYLRATGWPDGGVDEEPDHVDAADGRTE